MSETNSHLFIARLAMGDTSVRVAGTISMTMPEKHSPWAGDPFGPPRGYSGYFVVTEAGDSEDPIGPGNIHLLFEPGNASFPIEINFVLTTAGYLYAFRSSGVPSGKPAVFRVAEDDGFAR